MTYLESASATLQTGHATEIEAAEYHGQQIPVSDQRNAPNGVGPVPVHGLTLEVWSRMAGPQAGDAGGRNGFNPAAK